MTADVEAADGSLDPLEERPYAPRPRPAGVDRVFSRVTLAAGSTVLILLVLVGVFLLYRSWPAFRVRGLGFFTTTLWRTDLEPPVFGVLGLLWGTVVVALVALTVAVPVSVLTALFISDWSPPRLRSTLISLVDLLAAIPSLLYGLWGFVYLQPRLLPMSRWLDQHAGFIPIFRVDSEQEPTPLSSFAQSLFIAGLVVSLMVLPIITSVARETFSQAPPGEKEAALALGGSRWGMVRTVVLPFGRGGVIGGSMLGLGRALGETIAVYLLLSQVPRVSTHITESGGATISSFIVARFGGDAFNVATLLAAGLVLFVFTLSTNFAASLIIARSRSGAGLD
jgi:phosphate transport system permease protein